MVSTVYIAKNVYGGDGLGRLGDGRVAFVPGAFAGEQVKAEIASEKRGYVKMRLVEVVEPSPARTGTGPSPAPGMPYANLSFEAEMESKEAQLSEMLSRARIECGSVKRIAAPLQPLAYRNKAIYRFAVVGGKCVVGYLKEGTRDIIDMPSDPLVRPEINAALPGIRANIESLLMRGAPAVRRDVAKKERVTVRWSPRSGVKWWLGDDVPQGRISETTCGKTFEVAADGFYQVNIAAADALVSAVADRVAQSGCREIFDLYCGVGVFGIVAASRLGRGTPVTGVECGPGAIAAASVNAAKHSVKAVFIQNSVSSALKKLRMSPDAAVIADPPRGGFEKGVAERLVSCGAKRIFYVSCDPATFTRDLRTLSRSYDVAEVLWIDMFPRTARFESVAVLVRKDGAK